MNRWTISLTAAATAVALAASGCGSSSSQSAGEQSGSYPVSVTSSFPTRQRLAEKTALVIRVRNTSARTLPNVAVTLTNPQDGTAAQPLGQLLAQPSPGQPVLASRSRPVWIVDQGPGPCEYSCSQGGPGAGQTAYSNTWALGSLAPGRTVTFDWRVTAVQAGEFAVAYRVAAGLAPGVRAVGPTAAGTLHVEISAKPRQAYVNDKGQIVYTG